MVEEAWGSGSRNTGNLEANIGMLRVSVQPDESDREKD